RPRRAVSANKASDQLGNETLHSPRFDVVRRDRLNAFYDQIAHRQDGVEAEIGDEYELAGSVPALGVVARVGLGETACLGARQRLVEAEVPVHHRVEQVVGGGVQNALDFQYLAAFQAVFEKVDRR